ncbi:MAG: TonB-dependent receptor, partial [Gammaproteobacteria bacterium]|nr:TonB-dependent receptor [Gammaproteobacteria bacterium]
MSGRDRPRSTGTTCRSMMLSIAAAQQPIKVSIMNSNKKAQLLKRLGAAVATAVFATSGMAEVAAAEPAQDDLIEEIVVTANKRSQSVQDVAGSLTALGAEDLDARGIKDMYDIQFAVPSLHFGPQLGNQKITIRSISEFNRQPGVAVSLDGIYQSRSSTAHLYQLDLERIEVLRGPQGTLYGRNSNGGAVNFISAAPTREAEGMLRIGYAQYAEAKIEAIYSGPIGDRVAFRISADRIDRGEGWVENLVPGAKDLMRGESGNVRLKLAAEPTETLSMDLMYVRSTIKGPHEHLSWVTFDPALAVAGGTPQLVAAAKTYEPFKTHVNPTNDSDREFELLGLTLEWDMGWATLKSITSQQDFDDFVVADRDLTDVPLFDIWDDSTIDTFTQEINVLGSSDRLDWVLGAFYLQEEWDRHIVFNNAMPVFGFPVPSQFVFSQPIMDTDSLSWFLDATWEVTDRARVSAGVRRTEDEIDEYHHNQGLLPLFNVAIPFCDKAEQLD